MDTDIFSVFDPEGVGASESGVQPGQQEFVVEGADPAAQPEGGEPDGAAPEGGAAPGAQPAADTVTIKKEDWDRTQQVLAEFKGYMTAQQSRQPEPARPVEPQPQQFQQQQAQQAQLDQFLSGLAEDITSLDPVRAKAALQKAITAGAQLGAAQAAQRVDSATSTTADLIIENFVTRKAAKDELFDQGVGERFEERLKQLDPRALVNASRAQINAALEELYDAEAGRWAREKYIEAKKKRAGTARQDPTNYGGGRSAPGGAPRNMAIPETWKEFAKKAGIPEDQITPDLFKGIE